MYDPSIRIFFKKFSLRKEKKKQKEKQNNDRCRNNFFQDFSKDFFPRRKKKNNYRTTIWNDKLEKLEVVGQKARDFRIVGQKGRDKRAKNFKNQVLQCLGSVPSAIIVFTLHLQRFQA